MIPFHKISQRKLDALFHQSPVILMYRLWRKIGWQIQIEGTIVAPAPIN
jgi:hypothetical protein